MNNVFVYEFFIVIFVYVNVVVEGLYISILFIYEKVVLRIILIG